MRQKRRSYREPDDDDDLAGEEIAAVNERLDALTRQLERMAQANAAPRPAATAAAADHSDHVAEALARLDRRLDQVIAEGRAVAQQPPQQVRYAPPPAAPVFATAAPAYAPPPRAYAPEPPRPVPARGPANWAAQISARQRALEGGLTAAAAPAPAFTAAPAPAFAPPPAAPVAMPTANWSAGPDLSELQQQLQSINSQISSLHQPYENGLNALRGDLAEIGRALTEALPRRAIEALEGEVHALAERVDRTRQAGADGAALGSLERELVEIRNALHNLTPAENLAGFEEAVRGLYHKIDEIAAAGQPAHGDPMAFKQLEQAVVSLRGIVSNVASDGALAQLAAEVRGLGAQFEHATSDSIAEALGKLEARVAALMESGRTVPPELEGSIRQLSERLDRMQLTQGDQLALGALEDRIAKLSAKLDASDSRLGHLEAIERGLADLLVYLEEMRSGGPRGLRAPPAEPAPTAPRRPAPEPPEAAPAFAQSPLDLIQDAPPSTHPIPAPAHAPEPHARQQLQPLAPRSAPVEVEPLPPPESVRKPAARTMPRGQQRQPIDPNLPPDTPLEPGSGAPRMKPGSAAARIAASEAALGMSRPMAAESGGKSAAIAAARNAAKAAYLDTPVKVPKPHGAPSKWKWPFKKAAKATPAEPQSVAPTPAPPPSLPPMPGSMPGPMSGSMSGAAPVPMPHAMPAPMPAPMSFEDDNDEPLTRSQKIMKLLKTLLIAASVAIIVVGVAQTAIEFLLPEATPESSLPPKDQSQSPAQPKLQAPATTPSRPMPAPEGTVPAPSEAEPGSTNSISGGSSFFDPSTAITLPDVTGSISRKPASPRTPATGTPPAGQSNIEALPATIGPALRTAAAGSDPAAAYEMGARYAEGRGVPQSMPEAVRWFEKAAAAGFVPAEFRLASLSEKGEGVRKDVQGARRLYLAAAGKGHAKAMHNLAVLYAEGIDGKPDYKAASEWFRKAAAHGVTDSQYNLAILYARGIGLPVNLTESYQWFALAAANGDSDAAKKREEVAGRLDAKALMSARLAVQNFVPEREPDEATNLKAPPGGWDHTPAKPRRPAAPASTTR